MTRIVSNVRPWLHSLRQQRWPNSSLSTANGDTADHDDDHGLPSLADSHDTRLNEAFSTMMMSSAGQISGGDSKSMSRPSTSTTTQEPDSEVFNLGIKKNQFFLAASHNSSRKCAT
jgi:hypothetical protein